MNIHVRFTRDKNIEYYDSYEEDIDLEEYVRGSIAAEIGNSHIEACRALSVAIRTNALGYKGLSDVSPQAFRTDRFTSAYPNSKTAADNTAGWVLYYNGKIAYPASYSSNNGGHIKSSKEAWGNSRPWLISKDDPWDIASGCTSKPSHSVGASQAGLKYAAKIGISWIDMLNFYYPNTYLHNIYTGEDIPLENKDEEQEAEEPMAVTTMKASDLVRGFKKMADEHWPYVAGGTTERGVDCATAFYYWYKKYGSYMYPGSNTIWRQYTTERGKKEDMKIVPGMAVFVSKDDGNEPAKYHGDGQKNKSHIGCYVGNGLVSEAKSTAAGCCYSQLSDAKWSYAAKLKNTEYDMSEEPSEPFAPFTGRVTTASGNLNFRETPNGKKIYTIPRNEIITLTAESGGWYQTTYNGKSGWVSAQYITPVETPVVEKKYQVKLFDVPESELEGLKAYMTERKLAFSIEGGE